GIGRLCNERSDAEIERSGIPDVREEVVTLRSNSGERVNVLNAVGKIVTSCLAQMLWFEGKANELETTLRGGNSKFTDSATGLGKRVAEYRKGQDRQGASSGFKACGSEVDFRGESERIRR
ncbi:hypothetical protein THAOC_30477, partial [Thalassiosira oceanica]